MLPPRPECPRAADVPRYLVAVAGHASSPGRHRSESLAANLWRINSMAHEGSIKLTACLVYVHASEEAVPTNRLVARIPRSCAVVRNPGGSMLSHLLSIPAEHLAIADYVSVLIDSVALGVDVHLGMLARIMEHNCLHVASPACSTCKTKRTINHDYRREVGRYVDSVDLIAPVFSRSAFRCLLRLANQTATVDRYTWLTYALFYRVCRHYTLNHTGVVDAMSADKIEAGSSYNWTEALARNQLIRSELNASRPDLFRLARPEHPSDAGTKSGEPLRPPPNRYAAVAAHATKDRGNEWEPIVDVLVIDPPMNSERTGSEVAALMRAVRFRLSSHSSFVGATVICESTITSASLKPLRPLSSYATLWLSRDERLRHNVSVVSFPVARYERRVDIEHYGMGSIFKLTRTLWHSLIVHLEAAFPGRLVFASAPEEMLDAETLVRWTAEHQPVAASNQSHRARPAAASIPSLVARDPLAPWLSGRCAIPRLRGLRYGNASCPLPPRMRPYPQGDHLHGWARSAYLFSTRGDWSSWRGRRTVALLAEPPHKEHINPYMNERGSDGKSTLLTPVPPRLNWRLACATVPELESKCRGRGGFLCDATLPERRLCQPGADCYASEVRRFGTETRHLGWRMVDALLPISDMVTILNVTVPPVGSKLDPWQRVDTAAATDGVQIFSSRNKGSLIAKGYGSILQARHRELSAAWVAAAHTQPDVRAGNGKAGVTPEGAALPTATAVAEKAFKPLIERCADFRTLGMASPLSRADADALLRQAELPEVVDYGEPRWFANDEDARRAPPGVEGAFFG